MYSWRRIPVLAYDFSVSIRTTLTGEPTESVFCRPMGDSTCKTLELDMGALLSGILFETGRFHEQMKTIPIQPPS
jgi:hypothetical protein